jgi:8-oxo-dGTP pyrophosphatase MutT (NUDIX family)
VNKGAPAQEVRAFANVRPKDAATLIVLRRDPDALRVLMGRRAEAHAFMPGAVVFPGGKVERSDRYAPSLDELHPAVEAKLLLTLRKPDPGRARAIALAAIRETYEETGVLLGRHGSAPHGFRGTAWSPFLSAGVVPSLTPLRLIARAITPPGRFSRRFDARFFAVFADAVAAEMTSPDGELQRPEWLTFEEARTHKIPAITRAVLDGLAGRLREDAKLAPDGPVPFHVMRRGKFHVDLL